MTTGIDLGDILLLGVAVWVLAMGFNLICVIGGAMVELVRAKRKRD